MESTHISSVYSDAQHIFTWTAIRPEVMFFSAYLWTPFGF